MNNGLYDTLSDFNRAPSRRLPGLPGVPALLRKPLSVMLLETSEDTLIRHLTLFDLVIIGVAGTIGTGVFAIVGLIGSSYAGPAGVVSWLLAGVGCVFSGLSYAELSSIIPSEGGTYAYAFVALGELPAAIAAWCLTLEFGVSGAAVARVWADNILEWVLLGGETRWRALGVALLDPIPSLGVSPLAAILQAVWVAVLLRGVAIGKRLTTVLTVIKMAVCAFIIIAGFVLFRPENMVPFAPMGMPGIVRGSSAAFFGYLGYDEVCTMAGESLNPRRDVPLSIAYTLGIVSFTYIVSALVLSGMVPKDSPGDASFVMAFAERGWIWASQIVAIGEVVSLPVVVLASFLAQPRLLFVLANDGLLPKSLSAMDERGVLRKATLVSGVAMAVVAGVAPFDALDGFISAGVLLSFAITNSCAIVVRRSNLDHAMPGYCRPLVLVINGLSFAAGLLVRGMSDTPVEDKATRATVGAAASLVFLAVAVVTLAVVAYCPELPNPHGGPQAFRSPLSPWVQTVGIAVSWVLVAQLSVSSLLWTLFGVAMVALWYFTYGIRHSVGQRSITWPHLSSAVAQEASDTSQGFDSPPMGGYGGGNRGRRSLPRASFSDEPGRGLSPPRGEGAGEGQEFLPPLEKGGYMSFAALR
ncbi:unnamed protein product [Ascophyllum nodosum]